MHLRTPQLSFATFPPWIRLRRPKSQSARSPLKQSFYSLAPENVGPGCPCRQFGQVASRDFRVPSRLGRLIPVFLILSRDVQYSLARYLCPRISDLPL